jgi:hypothetical protein
MSRIQTVFAALTAQGRKALIPFITAGDPHPDQTLPLMRALVAGGADIIELGVPFSDPMADGPTIQRASERALAHGMSLRRVLALVSEFRKENDDNTGGADGLRQSGRSLRRRCVCPRCTRCRRRWRPGGRLSAGGMRGVLRRDEAGRTSIRSSCWHRPRPRSATTKSL